MAEESAAVAAKPARGCCCHWCGAPKCHLGEACGFALFDRFLRARQCSVAKTLTLYRFHLDLFVLTVLAFDCNEGGPFAYNLEPLAEPNTFPFHDLVETTCILGFNLWNTLTDIHMSYPISRYKCAALSSWLKTSRTSACFER